MESLKLLAAIVLGCLCAVFVFAVIGDFKYRNAMVHPWQQLALGVTVATLCGAGAYSLY